VGAAQQTVAAGSPFADAAAFQYAIYFLPKPKKDLIVALDRILGAHPNRPKLVDKLPKTPTRPVMNIFWEKDVAKNYAPPSLNALKYFARGLSVEQTTALQKSEQAMIFTIGLDNAQVWRGLKEVNAIVEELARETGGLLWDEETREVFTPDEWRKHRIIPWTEPVPDITKHITIHAYNSGEFVRVVTLGMAKFGLPDVVVQNFPWSLNRSVGHLVNGLSQSMAEGGQFAKNGEYLLNFRAIKNRELRESFVSSLKPNAKAIANLVLLRGKAEDGDPNNRLIEIGFNKYPGPDVHAKQEAMMTALFGWEDSVKFIKHDGELKAASQRARAKLPDLRKAFTAGLRPGEYIQVKAPFKTKSGSNEWMWVEITEWKGNAIRGVLRNEPFDVPDLKAGQIVRVREEDVFDYIRRFPNGKQEGNETSAVIEKMKGNVEKQN